MNLESLSKYYEVSLLSEADLPELLILCQGNPKFYRHSPPMPSIDTLRSDMHALPRGKNLEDKFYLKFWKDGRLAAVLDLILHYPNDQTAFFGFFMVRADLQGHGAGSALISEILSALSKDFSNVRLGYVKGNEQSQHFWEKNGFEPTGIIVTEKEYEIVIMEKKL
ncbi:MAG: GNAT family N-acetyltransferase [Clostridia bacterium]|nr:GNAT family N-acetyltransferase [Clostridia bacterium]